MKKCILTVAGVLAVSAAADAQFGVTIRTRNGGGAAVDRIRIETGVANANVQFSSAFVQMDGIGAPALSPGGSGRIFFDGAQFLVSQNGGAYVPMVGGGGGITSVEGQAGPAIDMAAVGPGLSVLGAGNTVTYTLTDLWVDVAGDAMTGNLLMNNQSDVRFVEAAPGANFVGFQAPAAIAADVLWTLPAADGAAGQFLQTNGAGALSWAAAGGGVASVESATGAVDLASTNALLTIAFGGGSLVNFTVNEQWVDVAGDTMTGNLTMDNQTDLRLREATANGVNFIAHQAPALLGVDTTYTWPASPIAGNVLQTDGLGNLSWAAVGAGGITSVEGQIGPAIDIAGGAGIAISTPVANQVQIAIPPGGVTTTEIAAGAVTMAKITEDVNTWVNITGDAMTGALSIASGVATELSIVNNNAAPTGPYLLIDQNNSVSMVPALQFNSNATGPNAARITSWGTFSFGSNVGGYIGNIGAPYSTFNANSIDFFSGEIDLARLVNKPLGVAAGNTGEHRFLELAANGVNYVGLKAPDLIAADLIWTLPAADGAGGQFLQTNGAGVLSWAGAAGGVASVESATGAVDLVSTNALLTIAFGGGSIVNFTVNEQWVDVTGDTMTGNLTMNNQSDVRFVEAAPGANFVGFQAPAAIGADILWTLPAADGLAGQFLQTNGAGVLTWAAGGGGGITSVEGQAGPAIDMAVGPTGALTVAGAANAVTYDISTAYFNANYIQNQSAVAQAGANSWVSGFHQGGTAATGAGHGGAIGALPAASFDSGTAGWWLEAVPAGTLKAGVEAFSNQGYDVFAGTGPGVGLMALNTSPGPFTPGIGAYMYGGTGPTSILVGFDMGAQSVSATIGFNGFSTATAGERAGVIARYKDEVGADAEIDMGYIDPGNIERKVAQTMGTGATVSAAFATRDGNKMFNAPEAPQAWLFDIGKGTLSGGKATVNLDPLFVDACGEKSAEDWRIFPVPTAEGMGTLVVKKSAEGFEVVQEGGSNPSGTFDWICYGPWPGPAGTERFVPQAPPKGKVIDLNIKGLPAAQPKNPDALKQ